MKADKNVVVHNSVKELYDSIYEIFKEIGASSSLRVKILDIIFISVPICYLIADYFKPVYSFIFLIICIVLFFITQMINSKKISSYYKDNLKIIPSNINIYESFYSKCATEKISHTVINNICELVDSKIENKQNNDFLSPVVLAVFLTLCINRIEDFIKDVEVTETFMQYEFIIPLLVCIYLIVWFISTIKIRELSLLKNCPIYTKIKYDLKDEEKIPCNKISIGEDCAKQNKNFRKQTCARSLE